MSDSLCKSPLTLILPVVCCTDAQLMTGNGSYDYKMDTPMDLARKPLASQKIEISSSVGTGNGFKSGAIDIYHIGLHFEPNVSQWCICPLSHFYLEGVHLHRHEITVEWNDIEWVFIHMGKCAVHSQFLQAPLTQQTFSWHKKDVKLPAESSHLLFSEVRNTSWNWVL